MKKIFFLATILISIYCSSQTHRFIYEFKYKPDSKLNNYEKNDHCLSCSLYYDANGM